MTGKRKNLWLKVVLITLATSFFGASLFLLWVINLDIPDFNSLNERVITESTKIYDRTGTVLLYDIHENIKRQVVPFEEISRHLKNATIAIEDDRFYQHVGIQPLAILRAVLVNLSTGRATQGGSTITQQLIKNTLLTQDKSIARKVKEWVLALKLERVMGKDDILELYLNETPYGGNLYGVEEAARAFFEKPARDVSLAEAAYIAALPRAPTFYSPYGLHRDRLEERKNLVLQRMRELGFIGAEEETAARAEKVTLAAKSSGSIKAPHFVEFVRAYLEEKYGRETVLTRGLKVTTTLDWRLQQKAEPIVNQYATDNITKFNARNAGLVAIEPKTGQILVMVGSRDYFDNANEGNFNVTLAHRQPGSAFKPFVYAAAFNEGYTPETMLFDVETQFDTQCARDQSRCYTPVNYDNRYRGPIDLRHALAQSINIPSIKTLYLAGIPESIALAKRMGIESLDGPERYGLTLVLGGGEVSLLDMTSAYGVFANDGVRNPYTAILKVEDRDGRVLEEYTPRPREVLPPNTARLISDILSDNEARIPTYGANSPLYFPGRQVAAKTGTTNDYKDAWILGYTPAIAVGAWAGNNDNTPMQKKVASFIVSPMWNAFMKEALAVTPAETLAKPESPSGSEQTKPVLRGIWRGGHNYFVDKISGLLATEYTPPDLREERVLTQIHSILYWLDKNNPSGPSPANPAADPQFALWETGIRRWLATYPLAEETEANIPTATDNVHRPEYAPRFAITAPNANRLYNPEERIEVVINYQTSRFPPSQLDVFLNDSYLGSINRAPFTFSFLLADLNNLQSVNTLKVVTYDSVRNRSEQTVTLQVATAAIPTATTTSSQLQ